MRGERDDRDDELLAAYIDGVTELTPEERRTIEARLAEDPALRDDEARTRALLGALRELPPAGTAPDWAAMERAIATQVGPRVPRPMWRSWRWLVPATMVAAAATALLVWLRVRTTDEPVRDTAPVIAIHDAAPTPGPAPSPAESVPTTVALWLDGEPVEVDETASELLDAAPAVLEIDVLADDGANDLLATDDLAWVDELGDDDVEVAEQVLGRKRS